MTFTGYFKSRHFFLARTHRAIRRLFQAAFFCGLLGGPLSAAEITLSGTVYGDATREPIPYAVVAVIEARAKTRTDEKGRFQIKLEPGEYTIAVNAPGVGSLTKKIIISETTEVDLFIESIRLQSAGAVIEEQRDIQSVSRYTVTNEEIKTIPATFGDSLGAVAAFAGIERNGTFGSLSVRGMDNIFNRYFIDGIPVRKPQHFGGLHSVIHNDLIDSIDIYSSAFPVYFGSPLAAVIEINTVDKVEQKSGIADVGLLSANALISQPIKKSRLQAEVETEKETENKNNKENEYIGYWAAGGRYGYVTLIVPKLVEAATGDTVTLDLYYYDYQAKLKYFLNKNHSLTFLFVGAVDYISVASEPTAKTREEAIAQGTDPLALESSFDFDSHFHLQSLLHTWRPSDLFYNKLRVYSSLNKTIIYQNIDGQGVADWGKDLNIDSRPNIFGVKNDLLLKWLDENAGLKMGADIAYYDFKASGKTLIPTGVVPAGMPNFADPDLFTIVQVDQKASFSTIGGYLENRFLWNELEAVAGYRFDHLTEHDLTTADPRGRLSYTFPTQTSVSVAGGYYSSFYQTNTELFDNAPEIVEADLLPQRALHRAAGIEQKIGALHLLKIEGYYNYYYDLVELGNIEKNGKTVPADNLGEIESYGVEITLKRERTQSIRYFYGWMSYTYGLSRHRSNLPDAVGSTGQPLEYHGDAWLPNSRDRRHSFKLISGYRLGDNYFDARFQYYSSFPYTPIIDDDGDPLGIGRYAPVYGKQNSAYFPSDHQLDLRYSHRSHKEWGSVTWYAEIINVYNKKPVNVQSWKYNKTYEKGVNPYYESESSLNILPNLGVEVKF